MLDEVQELALVTEALQMEGVVLNYEVEGRAGRLTSSVFRLIPDVRRANG